MSLHVLSGQSGCVPQSRDMQVRLIGDSKSAVDLNMGVNGYLCLRGSPV